MAIPKFLEHNRIKLNDHHAIRFQRACIATKDKYHIPHEIKSLNRSEYLLSEDIFNLKYRHEGCETWPALCRTLVHEVCDGLMPKSEVEDLVQYMTDMKFLPGGRYIYYAGRYPETRYYNNCFLLKAEEDTRQDWAKLSQKATSALMSGGGIGIDY